MILVRGVVDVHVHLTGGGSKGQCALVRIRPIKDAYV